ncbi:MAG: spermidine/putrescine ABC transporter permease [Candidatus Margulisbacteria bacterium GWF2_35_9]|nr:MAG: spermidine/putrescine ABC transporter permease [Candidatus Margulisbacteria bacterium GWF2_35_9]
MTEKSRLGHFYLFPLTIWSILFFVSPLIIIILYSFLTKDIYGGVIYTFSLKAYQSLIQLTYLKVFWFTLKISVISTAIIMFFAIPVSYYIARSPLKNVLLFLVLIPFWTNFLIRIYAWIAIMGNNGFLNQLLLSLHVLKTNIQFLYNPIAVIVVLVYTYLPFAILPLYAAIDKFDFTLLEASSDLGASRLQGILKVLLPNIRTGLMAAFLFAFIPIFGAYAVPQLVGGQESFMLGNMIARELTITRNWPLASAIATIITLVTCLGILLYIRSVRRSDEKDGK